MKAQEALQSQLEAVGTDVENTRGDVAGVSPLALNRPHEQAHMAART